MTAPVRDLTDDRDQRFWLALISEMFITAEQEINSGLPQDEALAIAFEELFHRIDFENMAIATSHPIPQIDFAGIKYTLIAICFGNFLAQKGKFLNDLPVEQ